MAEEKKQEETGTSAEDQEDQTTDASNEAEEHQEEENSEDENDADYWKNLAEQETEKRKKAEEAAAKNAYRQRKQKREDGEEDGEEEEEKPLTASQLQAILSKERQETQKVAEQGYIREQAKKLAGSDEEATAIIEIHKSRTFPDGMSLEEQIQEAHIIANGKKLMAQNSEFRRKAASKENSQKGGAENTHKDAPKKGEPQIPAQDKSELQRLGYSWDGKQWAKKTSTGHTLVIDPKTKKVTALPK